MWISVIVLLVLLVIVGAVAFYACLLAFEANKTVRKYDARLEMLSRQASTSQRELNILFEKNTFFDKRNAGFDKGFEITDQNFASVNQSINSIIRELKSLGIKEVASLPTGKSKLN